MTSFRELEDKLQKVQLQFEKAAIESKTKMSRLEEDKAKSASQIAEAQAETEKREEKLRAMGTKVSLETHKMRKEAEHYFQSLFLIILKLWPE